MKVVHVTSRVEGGAGIAAARLHAGLRREGVDSTVLTLRAPPRHLGRRVRFVRGASRQLREKLCSHVFEQWGIALSRDVAQRRVLRRLGGDYEIFSFPFSPYRLESHPLIRRADVVHLHWVAGLLDYPTFFRSLSREKRLVWTLHDMNPILGGFHYPGDFERNSPALQALDLDLRRVKRRAYRDRRIHFVVLSEWMRRRLDESDLVPQMPRYLIRNGLETDVFYYRSQKEAREELGLPSDAILILFISETLANHRKGFDLLLNALPMLRADWSNARLVAIGQHTAPAGDTRVRHVGRVDDPQQMAKYYQAADLFVLPSREDNLPNVMLESLCCGCPVLSFDVGGMRDVLGSDNGMFATEVSARALARALDEFVSGRGTSAFDRCAISNDAHQQFSLEKQATQIARLYRQVKGGSRA